MNTNPNITNSIVTFDFGASSENNNNGTFDFSKSASSADINIFAHNYNVMRIIYGYAPKQYLDREETKEEKQEKQAKHKKEQDIIKEQRKDEVEMEGECKYIAAFENSKFPESWLMFNHMAYNRQAIKDKANEFIVDEEFEDGTYGCPDCYKIFFKVKDNKIIEWSKAEFRQLMIIRHCCVDGDDQYFGICCNNKKCCMV